MARSVALIFVAIAVYGQALTAVVPDSGTAASVLSVPDTLDADSLDPLTVERDEPDTIEYSAYDLRYDVGTQTFNLNNKAQLKYRGAVLDADTIWFDQREEVLQASGNPLLTDQKNPPLAGYRMKYNLKTRIGQIYYGSSVRDGQRFNGVEIRRLPDTRLQIARGDFSTCNDSTHQHYYFYSRRMVVKPRENIVARPVVLNIEDVPVAVLPILVSPLKTGRKSGLLTPKFGGDQLQGFYMQNLGAYWAINDYMDATVKGDIIEGSQARFERSSAYADFNYKKRYVLDGTLSGRLYLEEFDVNSSDWEVNYRHNQNLTPDGRSKLSGEGSFVSRASVRAERSLEKEVILSQQANASLGWSWNMGNNRNLLVQMRQHHNLQTGFLERQIPDLRFTMGGALFQPWLDEGLSDDWRFLERFQYTLSERANVYYRQNPDTVRGVDTGRTFWGNVLEGSLFWNGQLLRYFNLTPRANYRLDWSAYRWENPLDSARRRMRMAWDPARDEYGVFYATQEYSLTGDTKLYGIWVPEWGRFIGVRHTLAPTLSYTYAPPQDTLYAFVVHPKLEGQRYFQRESKTVGMSLGSHFDVKWRSDALDTVPHNSGETVLRLLSSTHSTGYNFAADSFQWSPIASVFSLQLVQSYIFSVRTVHSVYHRFEPNPARVRRPQLTEWSFELGRSFSWNGDFNTGEPVPRRVVKPWSAGFSYQFGFRSRRVARHLFQQDMSHSSSMNLRLSPTRTWNMQYSTSYDYRRGEFAEHRFMFDKDLHCWRMNFAWTPVGVAAGWSFQIQITELPDIKLQASSTQSAR